MFIVSKIFNPNDIKLVIDGGASIGDTSEKLCNLFPLAEVHAFEPFPQFQEILKQKVIANTKIISHEFALGDKNSLTTLNTNLSDGTNSLFKSNSKSKEIYGSLMDSTGGIKVQTIRLDDWMGSLEQQVIDILKLDIQGGELQALNGANQILKAGRIKCVICEFMFEPSYEKQPSWIELAYKFESHGLRLFNLYQPHFFKGQLVQADLIFLNQSSLDSSELRRGNSFFNYSNLVKADN